MLLLWRIRYFDTRDRQFKDRDLSLDTNTLDPITAAAVEACHEASQSHGRREMLRYRHLFVEGDWSHREGYDCVSCFGIIEYFEDENGRELDRQQLATALTGNAGAILLPSGAKQH